MDERSKVFYDKSLTRIFKRKNETNSAGSERTDFAKKIVKRIPATVIDVGIRFSI